MQSSPIRYRSTSTTIPFYCTLTILPETPNPSPWYSCPLFHSLQTTNFQVLQAHFRYYNPLSTSSQVLQPLSQVLQLPVTPIPSPRYSDRTLPIIPNPTQPLISLPHPYIPNIPYHALIMNRYPTETCICRL